MDKSEVKGYIAARIAKELKDGYVVNLGIGIPGLATQYLPEGVSVTLHSENGVVGACAATDATRDPIHVTDAGGNPSAASISGAFVDSSLSFTIVRGGHVDATILGGLEVDEEGSISNWIIPGKKMPGMGGAMDLLAGTDNVIVAMEHTAKGAVKILKKCTLPYTAVRRVKRIITEMAVIDVTDKGLVLIEYNPEFTVEQIQAVTEPTLIISPDLKPMS